MKIEQVKKFLFNYYYYLQILVLAAFLYLLTWLIVNYVPPAVLANWFWPDSYLLFQVTLFGANFFFFTFLWQNRRLGAWMALTIFSFLFFKLAHFELTWPLIIALMTSSFLIFFWLFLGPWLKKRATAPDHKKAVKTNIRKADGQDNWRKREILAVEEKNVKESIWQKVQQLSQKPAKQVKRQSRVKLADEENKPVKVTRLKKKEPANKTEKGMKKISL